MLLCHSNVHWDNIKLKTGPAALVLAGVASYLAGVSSVFSCYCCHVEVAIFTVPIFETEQGDSQQLPTASTRPIEWVSHV